MSEGYLAEQRAQSLYGRGTSSTSGFDIINLILALLAIVGVIIVFFLFLTHRNSITQFGIAFKIQEGATSGATDTMKTGGNNMYIVNSNSALTLTLADEGNHLEGRLLAIKNNTTDNTTVQGEPGGINLDAGQLNLTVEPGVTALFLAKDKEGTYLRLQ